MQFQAKGQDYFLEYVDDEHSWMVFTQGADGIQRIPVYADGNNLVRPGKNIQNVGPKDVM